MNNSIKMAATAMLATALGGFTFDNTGPGTTVDSSGVFRNPVFEPILADPSVIKGTDGWFYAYGTQDDWGDGQGSRLVPVVRSRDLVHWTYLRNAFDVKPAWKAAGGIWAPDIAQVNGKYHLYYAFSTWGDANPGIGLAVSDSAAGPFNDRGKLFLSNEIQVPNSIDPFYMEDEGKKYLFWGSYSTSPEEGTYGVELSADGRKVPVLSAKFKIAAGDFEAVTIYKKGGYYYFIGSKGGCCDGAESKYRLMTGRSKTLKGPYLDQTGKPLTERGTGTLLLRGNEIYAGPGHCSRVVTDKRGADWLLYHAIAKKEPYVPSKANRRVLMLDRISWKEGWPVMTGNAPVTVSQPVPVF